MHVKKIESKKIIIALLIVLLLALAIGYAAFSDTLTISGTANAKGSFDLEFQNPTIVSAVGVDQENTTIAVSAEDSDILNVAVADLEYPGAGVEFAVDIVNTGESAAVIQSVTPTNISGSTHIIIDGLDQITTSHEAIDVGGTCTIHFTVAWDPEATTELTAEERSGIEFQLVTQYVQDTIPNSGN